MIFFPLPGNIAGLLYSTGKYDKSEAMYRESVEGFRRTVGPDHFSTIGK